MAGRAETISQLLTISTPTAIGVVGAVLLALPLRLVEGLLPTPYIPLIVVFFWTIYRPAFLPPASVFVIGLLQDLLSGGPTGLWPAIYLILQYVVLSQRSYFHGREQQVVWLGFAVAAMIASVILWLVTSLINGALMPIGGLAFQMAATIATYPLFAAAFWRLYRRAIVEV